MSAVAQAVTAAHVRTKLWQLSGAWDQIDIALWSTEGEITPEIQALLDQVEGDVGGLVDAVAAIRTECAAAAEACRAEARRLGEQAKRHDRTAETLTRHVQGVLTRLGLDRADGERWRALVRANPERIVVDDDAELDSQWVRIKTEPDKTALMAAHKRGEALPAGVSVERTVGLQIKPR